MTVAAPRIEYCALLGMTQAAALVGGEGWVYWLSLPRRGAPAAGPRGARETGRWQLAPHDEVRGTRRRYRGDSLVLETDVETVAGGVRLVDFVPLGVDPAAVVRLVEGIRGRVRILMDLRFDGGPIRAWPPDGGRAQRAIGEGDGSWLRAPVATRDAGDAVHADFFVSAGELLPFVLSRGAAGEHAPVVDPLRALADTESFLGRASPSTTFLESLTTAELATAAMQPLVSPPTLAPDCAAPTARCCG